MRHTSIVLAILLFVPALARAQAPTGPFRRATGSVSTPAVSLVAPGDALAVEVNPAAIAFLDSWGLTYVHADAQSDDAFAHRGDGLFFGAPLPFGLGIGAQLASVRPTQATGLDDRGLGSIALALAASPKFAMGSGFRFVRSDDFGARHVGWDLSFALRPSPRLGFALIGHDLNALVDLTPADVDVDATFALAAATRPFATDAVTIEAAGAVDASGAVGARGMIGVGVPRVGELRGVVEADDLRGDETAWRVTAGLDVRWGALGVGGGPIFGNGFEDAPGWWLSASLSGARHAGLPERKYVLDVASHGALGERGILELQGKLDRALHDDRVAGVVLRLRSSDAGLAYAQELRWLIARLEQAGKPVVCQLDSASGSEYYACAEASRTFLDPAGTIRLIGPSIDVIVLGELLDNIGVRADFVRIGKYKSAPEQFTRSRPSEPAQAQRSRLLDDLWNRLVHDLAADLETTPDRAARIVDRGPYATPEAVEAGLVTGEGDDLNLNALTKKAFAGAYPLRRSSPKRAAEHWGQRGRVGVVVIDGTMVDGKNVDVPLLDIHLSGARTVVEALERMSKDPTVESIVLRIDSPGGSALAADKIWRAVRAARKRKPVIASMGAVAASGGYYVASAADEIWADPATVTGSIGIFFGKVDVARLAERVGVHAEQLSRGDHAGAHSMWRPYTDEERETLEAKIAIWYRLFLERVAAGRDMTVEEVDAVGQGRIWTGDAALRVGLVDSLGGFSAALARARRRADLPANAGFQVLPFRPSNLLEYVLGDVGSEDRPPRVGIPPALRPALGLVATFGHARAGVPLALSPHLFDVR